MTPDNYFGKWVQSIPRLGVDFAITFCVEPYAYHQIAQARSAVPQTFALVDLERFNAIIRGRMLEISVISQRLGAPLPSGLQLPPAPLVVPAPPPPPPVPTPGCCLIC